MDYGLVSLTKTLSDAQSHFSDKKLCATDIKSLQVMLYFLFTSCMYNVYIDAEYGYTVM